LRARKFRESIEPSGFDGTASLKEQEP